MFASKSSNSYGSCNKYHTECGSTRVSQVGTECFITLNYSKHKHTDVNILNYICRYVDVRMYGL